MSKRPAFQQRIKDMQSSPLQTLEKVSFAVVPSAAGDLFFRKPHEKIGFLGNSGLGMTGFEFFRTPFTRTLDQRP
jgi:hypothetical protein